MKTLKLTWQLIDCVWFCITIAIFIGLLFAGQKAKELWL